MKYLAMIFVLWQLHSFINFASPPKPLGMIEKRNACIDLFARSSSWKYTLCEVKK